MELWGNNMKTILGNIKEVTVNWHYTTKLGEEYDRYHIRDKSIRKIIYNKDDKYCIVYYWDGGVQELFNINSVMSFSDKEREDMYDKYDNTDITLDEYVENFYR